MKVVFRVDSSLAIGSGHLIRCLALANRLKKSAVAVTFVSRDLPGNIANIVISDGHELVLLPYKNLLVQTLDTVAHAEWLGEHWSVDALETIRVVDNKNFEILVVDHYAIDFNWEAQLQPHFKKIVVIDDLADRQHFCDLLVDQNFVSNFKTRYFDKVPNKCELLLGPKFAILQPNYFEVRSKVILRKLCIKNFLVFFGLSDKENLTEMAIKCFLELDRNDFNLTVVGNPDNPQYMKLIKEYGNIDNLEFFGKLSTLAPLTAWADVVIGAGGTTSWERLCLGRKAIVITVADNQIETAKALHSDGLIVWLGMAQDVTATDLFRELNYSSDPKWHAGWPKKGFDLVDGMGLERICKKLFF